MFLSDSSSAIAVEYSLSVAWDVSTASYTTQFSVSSETIGMHGLTFKPDDGTKMYIVGINPGEVHQYSTTA